MSSSINYKEFVSIADEACDNIAAIIASEEVNHKQPELKDGCSYEDTNSLDEGYFMLLDDKKDLDKGGFFENYVQILKTQ